MYMQRARMWGAAAAAACVGLAVLASPAGATASGYVNFTGEFPDGTFSTNSATQGTSCHNFDPNSGHGYAEVVIDNQSTYNYFFYPSTGCGGTPIAISAGHSLHSPPGTGYYFGESYKFASGACPGCQVVTG